MDSLTPNHHICSKYYRKVKVVKVVPDYILHKYLTKWTKYYKKFHTKLTSTLFLSASSWTSRASALAIRLTVGTALKRSGDTGGWVAGCWVAGAVAAEVVRKNKVRSSGESPRRGVVVWAFAGGRALPLPLPLAPPWAPLRLPLPLVPFALSDANRVRFQIRSMCGEFGSAPWSWASWLSSWISRRRPEKEEKNVCG